MAALRLHLLSLYKQMLRESEKFSTYNFRMYAIRRTKDGFREHRLENDPKMQGELIRKAEKSLEIIKRQAAIGQLFTTNKLIIETLGVLPQSPQNSHSPPTA
ncbi:putative LYR motif-containing protein 4 [Hypsibius exemplaris]|uniref:LYR motif-containing protein 4 n=1 Tax=Hypsibius exemplaris TaxID=2072580 RepID=A0A9X6NG29_HYPEX|nr:putative LYR motif-containing protein 4 [Hypsibius exemplaris]